MVLNLVLLILALAAVVKSADWFLKAVEIIGQRFNIPPFLLGVLLVGFGTSLPELATSMSSVLSGTHNVTIANIIGSNMANILLIIGISTVFLGTISFKKNLINLDLPHLLGVSILFAVLISDGRLHLNDSLLLLAGFIIYLLYNLTQSLPHISHKGIFSIIKSLITRKSNKNKVRNSYSGNFTNVVLVLIGSVVILALASRLAITNMLDIAQEIDIAVEIVTFVTIALGTSLPELLVSFKALRKGQGDLVLGNIVGSSVFNILLVGGFVSLVHPQVIHPDVLNWSIIGLLVAAIIAVFNGITKEIHAWEGSVFILIYIALISQIIT